VSSPEEIRALASGVAAAWSADDAPASWRLNAEMFRVIAAHDDLIHRLSELPSDRLPALLASAAFSFLVRLDRPEPLARYFPQPGAPQPPLDGGFRPAATAFISARLDDIIAECRTHRYQMNEVARCTQIALGVTVMAGSAKQPVGLADLGTGAGLGLQLDRYGYVVGGHPSGPQAADLSLSCQVRGRLQPPPIDLPPITQRIGIDAVPASASDPAARAWLQACAPADASAQTRLAAALEVTSRHPPEILAGDVTQALPEVLDRLAPGRNVIVTDAYLAVFLPPEQRAELMRVMADAGRHRPVTWLSLDPLVPVGPSGRDSVQGLNLPASLIEDYQQRGVFAVLGARTFDAGSDRELLLAGAHPSGEWVEWLDDQSGQPLRPLGELLIDCRDAADEVRQ
jgi:hypothetical protein